MRRCLQWLRQWMEETHSTAFELRRHFFRRFFDSDLVSTPGQWRVVVAGAIAVLLSISLAWIPAYYHKYLLLNELDEPDPLRLAFLADVLFLIVLAMSAIGLLATLLWTSLFPGLRDYLALAALPIRPRHIFSAKFSALFLLAVTFVVAVTLPTSVFLPMLAAGRNAPNIAPQIPGIFVASSLGALFVFFTLVALQGVLLNVLPTGLFARLSLLVQGALLIALLCGFPFAFSITSLDQAMTQRPDWLVWAPPAWFLGLDQVIAGNREPLAVQLAWLSLMGVAASAAAAVLTYIWSYRRHRVRVLESVAASPTARRRWLAAIGDRMEEPRELAVFAFIAKTLARSRQHRLILTAYAALAMAMIVESFVSLAVGRNFRGFSVPTPALRQAVISAPLALSLFVLAGFRYLFRLPVELRANWVFRVNAPGNRLFFLAAVERFLIYCAVAPVALLTLPLEMRMLGAGTGLVVTLLCALPSLTLMEFLLLQFERVPFTSSYLPGQRPLVQTLLLYALAVTLYVSILGGLIALCLQSAAATLVLFVPLIGVWWRARTARLQDREVGEIEFEETMEPAVLTLSIERD